MIVVGLTTPRVLNGSSELLLDPSHEEPRDSSAAALDDMGLCANHIPSSLPPRIPFREPTNFWPSIGSSTPLRDPGCSPDRLRRRGHRAQSQL
jgi:hypothetical protein